MKYNLVSVIAFLMLNFTAYSQFVQQSEKLIGSGGIGNNYQGVGVALSADGNTLLSGGCIDNGGKGAAWVFTRTNAVWSQQGPKLVGTGGEGNSWQGYSVSLSADGNTALSGGLFDNNNAGAVWVFNRANSAWSQQGQKLTVTDNIGPANIGYIVAVSADGNTAITGGYAENNYRGAAWIFSRQNGLWVQQGPKLIGTGNTGIVYQGYAVAISADGNTAVSGGILDDNLRGSVWVFTRSNGVWSQQGEKLVGSDCIGTPLMGYSVSISADGNTIVAGGPSDDFTKGAVWVFTRNNGVWSQYGNKLTCTDNTGNASFGYSVSISGDGKIFIAGGPEDNNQMGAAWIFKQNNGIWSQYGTKLIGSGNIGNVQQGYIVSLSSDGHTAVIGGPYDNGDIGAAWVFNEYSADGSGTMTIAPNSSYVTFSSLNYVLTFTASTGGLFNGQIDIAIPGGWSIESVTSSNGTAAIVDGVIRITGVTLNGGSQLFINLNNTTNGNSPGENIFAARVKTTAGGILTPLVSSPSVYLNSISNNGSITITSPSGGERLKAGTLQYITWERRGIVMGSFLLEYSIDNGKTWIRINRSPIAGVARYSWLVPDVNSDNCLIRISNYLTKKPLYIIKRAFSIYTEGREAGNYPNPFNPSTKISFYNANKEFVTLKIYNSLGQQIAELVHKELSAGKYEFEFNGSNLPSGVYFYNLTIGNKSETHKMILAK